jgi:hypothetical protein
MRVVVWFALVVLVINCVLLGLGIVTGLLLRLVFPSIDWGMSVLIGLVSSVVSIRAVMSIFGTGSCLGTAPPPRKARKRRAPEEESHASEFQQGWTPPSVDLPTWTNRRQNA